MAYWVQLCVQDTAPNTQIAAPGGYYLKWDCPQAKTVAMEVQLMVVPPESSPAAPFDYALASQFWGLAFTTVLSLYLMSHGIGRVLAAIRGTRY